LKRWEATSYVGSDVRFGFIGWAEQGVLRLNTRIVVSRPLMVTALFGTSTVGKKNS